MKVSITIEDGDDKVTVTREFEQERDEVNTFSDTAATVRTTVSPSTLEVGKAILAGALMACGGVE